MFRPATLCFVVLSVVQGVPFVYSQFLNPVASDTTVTTIQSPTDENVTIKFRTPSKGTCTTVFQSQKQYTGYVSLPPYTIAPIQQKYPINTFFWFIEARTNSSTAPLTIYINGGPGTSSMVGLFLENGPCEVIEIAEGKFGTRPRDWGWDRSSNILYVDQPNEVGFSYDVRTNGSLDLLTSEISYPPSIAPPSQPSFTYLNGTFSSNNANRTSNTTEIAAHAIWHMLQGFLGAFPQYNPSIRPNHTQSGTVGVNLFVESYGGKYGPAFAVHWENQNLRRKNGSISGNNTFDVSLASLGILQGCIDDLVQGRFYPIFANNNTYGIKALSLIDQQAAANSFINADGCQQLIQSCRSAVALSDSKNFGNNATVNQLCQTAAVSCNNNLIGPFHKSGRSVYDITQQTPDPFPASTYLEYLNSGEVQAAIGAAVNYTETNAAVVNAFRQTGDSERGNQIEDMAFLLSLGVRVALIYGDRDYICNWLGGEAVSFSVAAQSPTYTPFYSAGYSDIVVNDTYVGGAVRQFGNLSFSRIYDAGHLVPAYQPETVFTVFTRIIMGTGISLGEAVDLAKFSSKGDANATYTNTTPEPLEAKCYIRNIKNTCSEEQQNLIQLGEGSIINGVLYDNPRDWIAPDSSLVMNAGFSGNIPTMTDQTMTVSGTIIAASVTGPIPTGVFVATSTPSTTRKGAAANNKLSLALLLVSVLFSLQSFGFFN